MQALAHTGTPLHLRHTRPQLKASHTKAYHIVRASQSPQIDLSLLESACSTCKAQIGYNQLGYRGLLATEQLYPGDTVVSVPLHNILQVPRNLGITEVVDAAQAALATWQKHHGLLPRELVALIMDAECPWEAKLVYWLLHLKATAAPGTLWNTYCHALPSQQDTLGFFCYSEEQAEQLQFSTWQALAAKQRQLLYDVQQQGQKLCRNCNSNTSRSPDMAASSAATQQDIAWALSMVKSRTFGRVLEHNQCINKQLNKEADALHPAASLQEQQQACDRFQELGSLQGGQHHGELEPDESDIVLLMVPFVDMINHCQQQNCSFGVHWQNGCFEITSNNSIAPGEEITISYGSNKSNLALLSCYGFFIPGNRSDAQLLQPIFQTCSAVAEGITGFEPSLLEAAASARLQEIALQGDAAGNHTGDSAVQAARVECAAAAMPVQQQQQPADTGDGNQGSSKQQPQLQLQKYLAELILYQIQQMLKLCGTSVEEDAGELQQLQDVSRVAADSSSSLDYAIQRQAVAARMEQKLLLLECKRLCQRIAQSVIAIRGN